MLPFAFLLFLSSFLSLPVLAAEPPIDLLEEDVGRVEGLLEDDREDTLLEAQQRERALSKELFPEPAQGEDERAASITHVFFQEAGTTVILWDVPLRAWYAPYVRYAATRGIVSGYRDAASKPVGAFGPGNPVLIEELAKMAVEASGLDLALCGGEPRNSTAAGRWSAPYIACAEGQGWAIYSDAVVDVLRPALRNEVIVTVLQAFQVSLKPLSGTGRIFSDVSASVQFASAIETAARAGIVSGHMNPDGSRLTGEFKPASPVNRAEVAKILTLALQLYAK